MLPGNLFGGIAESLELFLFGGIAVSLEWFRGSLEDIALVVIYRQSRLREVLGQYSLAPPFAILPFDLALVTRSRTAALASESEQQES